MSLLERQNYVIYLFTKELYCIINNYWNSEECLICENFIDIATSNLSKYSKISIEFKYEIYVYLNLKIENNIHYDIKTEYRNGDVYSRFDIPIRKLIQQLIHDRALFDLSTSYKDHENGPVFKYCFYQGFSSLIYEYVRRKLKQFLIVGKKPNNIPIEKVWCIFNEIDNNPHLLEIFGIDLNAKMDSDASNKNAFTFLCQ